MTTAGERKQVFSERSVVSGFWSSANRNIRNDSKFVTGSEEEHVSIVSGFWRPGPAGNLSVDDGESDEGGAAPGVP